MTANEKTIRVSTTWTASRVRELCITQNYYTRGDNDDYEKMLQYVKKHNPNTETLYHVARDIVDHSDLSRYGQDYNGNVSSVMFELADRAVFTFFEVDDLPF